MKIYSTHDGFTFLEFICVLAIIGTLYFMAIPFTHEWKNKNQREALSFEIISAIHYARNMAIVSHHRLALTPSLSPADWSQGMRLFIDNAKHSYDPEQDHLLYEWKWKNSGVKITWNGFQSNRYLLFNSDLKHAAMNGHFDLMDNTGHRTQLTVNRIGRVNASKE